MSLLHFILVLGLPTVGALAAWSVGLRAWSAARSQIPHGPEGRETRSRVRALAVLPSTLIVFGLVISLLLLGESVSDAEALPVALAYSVPALLSGVGMAIIYRRGVASAATKHGFGRVMPLAVMPETSAVFGLVVSVLLLGRATNPPGVPAFGIDPAWLAAMLSSVGSIGGPLGAWLAASEWDFTTSETWPEVLSKSSRGGMLTAACFALAMAVLGQLFIVLLLVLWFGVTLGVAVALFVRARRKRQQTMKPS